jgi:hypothetical protein
MSNSDDAIEEMVRSAIILFAGDSEKTAAALEWLDQRLTVYAAKELGLLTS